MFLSFIKNSLFSLFFLSLLIARTTSLPATIGVTYAPTPTTPPPERVANAVHSFRIPAVRLPDPTPTAVRAFSYSNISLLLYVPNSLVPSIADNRSAADLWLYTHVVPFYPRAKISAISVGTDILDATSDLSDVLLPAMRNLRRSLNSLGIYKIAISSTFSFVNIMTTVFPPSSAEFLEPAAEVIIKPLLDFLAETNSSFFVNLYPYYVYKLHNEIPIGLALFQEEPFTFRDDLVTGVRYRNLFDMMVDALLSAMAVAGHENIPIVVTETGWPSSGDSTETDADEVYAGIYIKGLIRHLKSGFGTPLRKEGVAETYIYELFDTDEKRRNESGEQHWGILYRNMTKKYLVDFSAAVRISNGGGWIETAVLGLFFIIRYFLFALDMII